MRSAIRSTEELHYELNHTRRRRRIDFDEAYSNWSHWNELQDQSTSRRALSTRNCNELECRRIISSINKKMRQTRWRSYQATRSGNRRSSTRINWKKQKKGCHLKHQLKSYEMGIRKPINTLVQKVIFIMTRLASRLSANLSKPTYIYRLQFKAESNQTHWKSHTTYMEEGHCIHKERNGAAPVCLHQINYQWSERNTEIPLLSNVTYHENRQTQWK